MKKNALQRAWALFTDPKHVVMLLVFSLVCSNLVMRVIHRTGMQKTVFAERLQHMRVFQKIELELNRTDAHHEGAAENNSDQLASIQRDFSQYQLKVIFADESGWSESDQNKLQQLKQLPPGRALNLEQEEEALTSIYLIRNLQKKDGLLFVQGSLKEDLEIWNEISIELGFLSFLLFFAFGWFWSRALTSRELPTQPLLSGDHSRSLERVQVIERILAEVDVITLNLSLHLPRVFDSNPEKKALAVEDSLAWFRVLRRKTRAAHRLARSVTQRAELSHDKPDPKVDAPPHEPRLVA